MDFAWWRRDWDWVDDDDALRSVGEAGVFVVAPFDDVVDVERRGWGWR
jgi:hypothetical protein